MAGATNKAMKAAGLPAKSIETVRVARGSGLSVQSAIQHAQAHGLPMGKAKSGDLTGWQKAAAGVKVAPQEQKTAPQEVSAASASKPSLMRNLGSVSKHMMAQRKAGTLHLDHPDLRKRPPGKPPVIYEMEMQNAVSKAFAAARNELIPKGLNAMQRLSADNALSQSGKLLSVGMRNLRNAKLDDETRAGAQWLAWDNAHSILRSRASSRMLAAAAQVRAAGKPEAGHVLVNRGGQVTSEKEVHSRGPFSVHREGDGFAITHKPTGMAMARTKSEATARDIVNGIGDRGERLSDRMMGGDERASRVLARYVQAQGSKGKRLAAAHMAKALESAKDRRAQLVRQNENTARTNAANRKAAEEYWKPAAQRSAPAAPKASPFTVAQPPAARAAAPARAPAAPASRATYQRGEAGANAAVAAMRKDIRAKVDEVRALESHVANLHRYRAKLHAQRKPKQEQMVRESVKEFEPKLAAKRRELSAALAARGRVATARATKSRLERAGQGSLF